jgi:hypothetical protein
MRKPRSDKGVIRHAYRKFDPSTEWLRERYEDRRMSAGEIAAEAGVSETLVKNRLVEHSVQRRNPTWRFREIAAEMIANGTHPLQTFDRAAAAANPSERELAKRRRNSERMKGRVPQTRGRWIERPDTHEVIYVHSTWEERLLLHFIERGIRAEYEPRTFPVDGGSYTPDFYLPDEDRYIEVKGYWFDKQRIKFNRFRALYPHINIEVWYGDRLIEMGVIASVKAERVWTLPAVPKPTAA